MSKNMIAEGNTFHIPICNGCIHFIEGTKCEAFDKIPTEILNGENDHSEPLPIQEGYNSIIFEPK